MIDRPAIAAELMCDPSVPVAWLIDDYKLNGIAQKESLRVKALL